MVHPAVHVASDGILLDVRVIPRSGRSRIDGVRDGALLVRLHAAPVDDAANEELREVLADTLGIPKRSISILSGARTRRKRLHVSGVEAGTAAARLGGQ